ncbi:universal stress protein [Mobilicoccus massiliensis]|uniref:universal stress protein n=1 Tax=Mobilicoccus massiliensis TaxID=1522310 RepID=UPI00058FEE2D|nr:universal stress protein [Mobilicoccus massiliensis]
MSVVVGYIPTKEGRAALEHAASEAKLRGCDLILVNSTRSGRDPEAEAARKFEESLAEVRSDLENQQISFVERSLARGQDPAEDLIDVAEEVDAQCIVIGLRRRSPIGKLVLGSNAQRILLDARCPVIAVKATS